MREKPVGLNLIKGPKFSLSDQISLLKNKKKKIKKINKKKFHKSV
jgi:hypothetical protein